MSFRYLRLLFEVCSCRSPTAPINPRLNMPLDARFPDKEDVPLKQASKVIFAPRCFFPLVALSHTSQLGYVSQQRLLSSFGYRALWRHCLSWASTTKAICAILWGMLFIVFGSSIAWREPSRTYGMTTFS